MREMALANMAEIETANLALKQSNNDQVKTFAQKMIDDHTQAHKELEQIAQAKGVTLPTEPDREHKAEMKKLSALEGEKFDKRYMSKDGIKEHRETHRMVSRAQTRATDPDLKALAAKMEPIVADHLKMAQDMRSGKGTATGSSGSSGSSMGPAGTSSTPGAMPGSSGSGSPDSSGTSGSSGSPATSGSSGASGSSGSPGSSDSSGSPGGSGSGK